MKGQDRKAAISAYKERKVEAGIYAVRCRATGEVWVGQSPDLSKIQNRLWFTLGQGLSLHRSLQRAWRDHGAEAFVFEIVARFEEDEDALDHVRARERQACLERWAETLCAVRI